VYEHVGVVSLGIRTAALFRQSVLSAITSVQQRLKLYSKGVEFQFCN
jgi:hypothetical protein